MFKWRMKATNAIFLEDNNGQEGRPFKSRFLQAGLVKYDFGVCLLKKETIDKFVNTFVGNPVIINHKDNLTEADRVGTINKIWFSAEDGWFWCEGVITDDTAVELIEKGYNVSCQYRITEYSDNTEGKLHNANPYDKEILNGVFEHLAIVENPRYEDAFIAVNAYIQKASNFVEDFKDMLYSSLAEGINNCLGELHAKNEEKWITVHPNGKENEGRPLLIKDGESVEDALNRKGWYSKRQAKDEKENKQKQNNEKVEEIKQQETETEKERKNLLEVMGKKRKEINKQLDEMLSKVKDVNNIKELYNLREVLREKLYKDMGYNELSEKNKNLAEKQTQLRLEKNRILANENITPKTIAGVTKGSPMSTEKANGGSVNPQYGKNKNDGYDINCQSCVVCYEARLRGYDVSTSPNLPGSAARNLERQTRLAWLNPVTGEYAEPNKDGRNVKNAKECLKFLENNVKDNERYNFGFSWSGRTRDGHIITLYKENGKLIAYDPQVGEKYTGKDIHIAYLSKIKYTTTLYGEKTNLGIDFYRIDNLAFNPEYMNDIMKGNKNE